MSGFYPPQFEDAPGESRTLLQKIAQSRLRESLEVNAQDGGFSEVLAA